MPGVNGNATLIVTGECTFDQNLYVDIEPYNAFVLAMNFFTVLCVFCAFYFESERDKWLLGKFEANPSLPDDALQKSLGPRTNPESEQLYSGLLQLNRQYLVIFRLVVGIYICNAVVSGVLVFKFYYINYRTATTFLTSLLLVGTRMYNSLALAQQSFDAEGNCRAQSVNIMEPTSFNSIRSMGGANAPPAPAPAPGKNSLEVRSVTTLGDGQLEVHH